MFFYVQEQNALASQFVAKKIIGEVFDRMDITEQDQYILEDLYPSIAKILSASADDIAKNCPIDEDVPGRMQIMFG